jgi:hypothetical protein
LSINKTSSCGGQGLDCKFQVINFKKGWSFGLIKLSSCPAPGLHVSQQLDSKFQEGKSNFKKTGNQQAQQLLKPGAGLQIPGRKIS